MIAVVIAGGGERAVAWETGVLAGLADAGLDLRRADAILGTSAGSLVAARLAAGLDPRDARPRGAGPVAVGTSLENLGAAWMAAGGDVTQRRRALGRLALARSPGDGQAVVATVAERLPGGDWPAALRIAVVDADSGERVILDGSAGTMVATAVAASRAIPGMTAPVTVGGRRCIDGALGSATNADALTDLPAGRIVIVSPLPHGEPDMLVERLWAAALVREVECLRAAGHDVSVVRATPRARAAMGPDLMSGAGGPRALRAGRDQIRPRRAA